MLCVNVQSLLSNLAQVEILIFEYQPYMLFCTEARVTSDVNTSEIKMNGYNVLRSDAASRHSGGVVLYFREDLSVTLLANHIRGYDHILVVEVLSQCCRGTWAGVYHSPGASDSEFLTNFESAVEPLVSLSNPLTIAGDFNINVNNNNPVNTYKQRLRRFEYTHSLKQLITDFTRVTVASRTTVDLVFTNNNMLTAAVSKNNVVADHKLLIIYKRTVFRDYFRKRVIDRKHLTASNFEQILEPRLESYSLGENVEDRARCLTELIDACASELVSERMVTIAYMKRWFNDELRTLRQARNEAENMAQFTNNPSDWNEYKRKRNLYNKKLKQSKNQDLISIIASCEGDQRKMWRHLKSFIDEREAPPSCIVINNQRYTDNKEIANGLNEYFISSINEIKSTIPYRPYDSDITDREFLPWLQFEPVNEAMVNRVIINFKSKSGINNVNKDVFRYSMNVCSDEIVDIFNESFRTGVFPDAWKFTIVTPIPKIKGSTKAEDQRPINNCHQFDKAIQTLAKQQLDEHIRANNIISECQSAYREKHSCETALNFVLAGWIQKRASKQKIVAVFLDLSRAFETIDREILIDILEKNGIGGIVLNWFKSWLTNRRQYTRYKEILSEPKHVDDGIPQGTPLSSVLFNLYINLIVRCLVFCEIKLFADDCLIWIAADDLDDAVEKMNSDLTRIWCLLQTLKLKLNSLKTKCMYIGAANRSDYSIDIDGQTIECVEKIKYLGVIIDDRLTFKDHCEYIVKKLSKKVNFLRRIRNKLDIKTSLLLFNSLIAPHIDFCSTILFMLNETDLQTIQLIQNRALRIILNRARDTSIVSMHQEADLLTVRQRIKHNVLLFMFKATKELLPPYITNQLAYVADVQPYALRSNQNLRLPQLLTNMGQRSFLYRGAQMFNEMVRDGVTTNVLLKDFKTALREYVKVKYQ